LFSCTSIEKPKLIYKEDAELKRKITEHNINASAQSPLIQSILNDRLIEPSGHGSDSRGESGIESVVSPEMKSMESHNSNLLSGIIGDYSDAKQTLNDNAIESVAHTKESADSTLFRSIVLF